jgi:RimJ/RimL family protein N-acetyltransferase
MVAMETDTDPRLEPWDERGLVLERRANVPEMTVHLGGVEPDERAVARHERILAFAENGRGSMFLVLIPDSPDPVGSVGFWEREWQGEAVWETGWKILPGFQGRGLAAAATATSVGLAAAKGRHRWMHAYPKVSNGASNAICRKVGFELQGEVEFEYPPGSRITSNDWRYDLRSHPRWA